MTELELHKKVALLAKSKGVSQKELAAYCKISRITVHRFLNGKTEIRSSDFVKMLELLGVDIVGSLEKTLLGNSISNAQAEKSEPVFSDVSLVLKNLKNTVRRALLEQITWWGQTSHQEDIVIASQRIKDYIRQTQPQTQHKEGHI
jgi:transcriptional regulator with XRE-family HTH domain